MELRFDQIGEADIEALVAWLPSETCPFHGRTQVDESWVRARAADGDFYGPAAASFWIRAASPESDPASTPSSDTEPLGPGSAPRPATAPLHSGSVHSAFDVAPLGIVRVFDLPDVTPLVDLRIAAAARGRRVGTAALLWITRHVFVTAPNTVRLGGYTRHDNLPMMRVFEKCSFVREAYHRKSWPIEGGALADSVGYSILRSDWLDGTQTPMPTLF